MQLFRKCYYNSVVYSFPMVEAVVLRSRCCSKKFCKIYRKTPRGPIFSKLQVLGLGLHFIYNTTTQCRYFPVNFMRFFKIAFFQNSCGQLFLTLHKKIYFLRGNPQINPTLVIFTLNILQQLQEQISVVLRNISCVTPVCGVCSSIVGASDLFE